jgi:hypothetical protein
VMFTTTDNFDFTGGEGGQATDLGGGFRSVRPDLVGDPKLDNPDPLTGYFNTAVFARPSGRGDFGDAPRNAVEKPGSVNWNLAAFKNFGLGGRRSAQVRVEVYNVLNTNQFSDINRTARFDATGRQIDPTFGIATATRAPRQMQLSFRFSF